MSRHPFSFAVDPTQNSAWTAAFNDQTPRPITDIPVMVIQGTADEVVLPNTTAVLNDQWCAAGSNLTTVWVGGQGHNHMGEIGGTMAGIWFHQILAGKVPTGTCGVPNTVAAYPTPVDPGFGSSV